MNRRLCIKYLALAAVLNPVDMMAAVPHIRAEKKKVVFNVLPEKVSTSSAEDTSPTIVMGDKHIKDYLSKIRHPNTPHPDDILLDKNELKLLDSVVRRLQRVRAYVGHGHFCILGFDRCIKVARNSFKVGQFSKAELDFMEEIYFRDAKEYGFFGEKQIMQMTEEINPLDVYKVPYSGNYLFLGASYEKYLGIQKKIGEELILTSGIRGVTKQFYLFLSKAHRFKGNLSLASRSLAPPGYSYHATGDFDVGQRGLGGGNFSEGFTNTPVYKRLTNLGYVRYRYERDNMLGVRYEPWHVKL